MAGVKRNVVWHRARLFVFALRKDPKKRRIASIVVLSAVAFLLVQPSGIKADTQGANNPTAAVNDSGISGTAWTNPGNVFTSNNGYAAVALSNDRTSQYIKATGFGFSIPAGATINGIVAEVERSEAGGNSSNFCQDNAIRIVKNGTVGSTDQTQAGDWPASDSYATYGTSSDLWGETWSVTDINSANFGFAISAKNRRSSGNPSTTETCRVDHIRITVHYTPPPTTYDQSSYRWFSNNNGTSVGTALAAQDTVATAPAKDSPFRLRMTLHVGTTALPQSGENFKLQFAKKGSGSCSSPEFSYADVTGSSDIRYYDNASASDNTALSSSVNDPVHSAHTTNAQNYEEANDFTNGQSSITTGEDGMWDFALVDSVADYNSNYCFRAVKSTGTALDSYGVYPEITTAGLPAMDQSAFRLFEHDVGSTDVGLPLAAQDTGAVFTGTAQEFRLRMNLHANTNKLKTSGDSFKLQFAQKGSGTCASPEFSYGDVSPSAGEIRFNGSGNDDASLTDNANDPVHSGHTNRNQTYEEANNFTNSQAAIAAGEDGMWDFSLIDSAAPAGTSYCFRAVKTDGSPLNSYAVYPQIRTFSTGETGTATDIVNASSAPVASPFFSLESHLFSFDCSSVAGVFGSSSQRIRVANGFVAENWSLTIAATSGPTANWSGGPTNYDFNDNSGSPAGCGDGGDSDSFAGQLLLDPSIGTLSPKNGCTTTGITKGSSGAFIEGAADSLTLLSGNTTSDTDCYWDFTGVDVSQQIPFEQPPGTYSLDLTLTLTAF
jgi:hypothetical protein